jgi:hypothetical protein
MSSDEKHELLTIANCRLSIGVIRFYSATAKDYDTYADCLLRDANTMMSRHD